MGQLILIADDHEGVRTSLIAALKHAGFEAIAASDGEEAVRLAREKSPAAALLDVVMPGRDGLWACREIRAIDGLSEIPVIMCTVKGTKTDIDAALSAGADDYVVKPFHPDMVVRKVQRLLAEQELEGMERRGSARRDAKLSMVWQSTYSPPTGVVYRATITNISVTGIAFTHKPDPPPEEYAYEPHTVHPSHPFYRYAMENSESDALRMTIELPNRAPIEAEAKFVYIVKAGDEEICGAQFTKMGDDEHSALAEFVMAELKDLIDSKHD